jgi:hypothetical protein
MFGLAFVLWQALEGRPREAGLLLVALALAGAADAPLIPLVRRETPERPDLSTAVFTDEATWTRARALADATFPVASLNEAVLEEHDAMQVVQNSTTLRGLLLARFVTNPLDSTPGALAYVVGIAGAVAAGRRGRGWLVIAAGATVLTLGPYLMLDETPPLPQWSADHPLPYAWAYQSLPFFSKAYRPYRIGVIALLALAGAAATGMGRRRASFRDPPVAIGVVALGLVAFSQPLWAGDRPAARPLADATVPPIYTRLRDAGPGAVIELPLQYQPLSIANARFQYDQVVHGHPLLNCNQLIRRTDLLGFRDYVVKNGFLSTLLDIGRRPAPLSWTDADLRAVLADGFRWLVVHRTVEADDVRLAGDVGAADLVGQPAIGMLREALGAPTLTDDDTWVFALPATWDDHGRTWTWSGAAVDDLDTPYDIARFGLPVDLAADDTLPVADAGGPATLSFWVRPLSGAGLVVRADGTDVPVPTSPGRWRWVEVHADHGQFSFATTEAVSVGVTRLQVVHE